MPDIRLLGGAAIVARAGRGPAVGLPLWSHAWVAASAVSGPPLVLVEVPVLEGAWFVRGVWAPRMRASRHFSSNAAFVQAGEGREGIDPLVASGTLADALLSGIERVTGCAPACQVIGRYDPAEQVHGPESFQARNARISAHSAGRECPHAQTAAWRLEASRAAPVPWVSDSTRRLVPDRRIDLESVPERAGERCVIRTVANRLGLPRSGHGRVSRERINARNTDLLMAPKGAR